MTDPEQQAGGDPGCGLTLVVPLFNEEQRFDEFGQLLIDFVSTQAAGSELIFVDDGSEDRTAERVERLLARNPSSSVHLIRRTHEGKGAAVAAGLRAGGAPLAAFCDLDLSTPLDQLERVLRAAARADILAVGTRDLATSRLVKPEGRIRETLGRAYNRLLQATITPGIVDTQCGAKAARRRVWDRIVPRCNETGYAWDAEAIAVARALGIVVHEVPIEWSHDERSSVHLVRDGVAMVLATPRIRRNARRLAMTSSEGAVAGEVFDDVNGEVLSHADTTHWWFRSKAALVATAARRTRSAAHQSEWLADVGAGSDGVTSMLGWDPNRLIIVEGNEALVGQAHTRHGLCGIRGTVETLPLAESSIDVVCLLDVLEHLDDPISALREARRVLAPDGRIVITVPAHQWLWSEADVFLGHVRRYTRPALRRQLLEAGFRPRILTHVFSWLTVPVWLKRRGTKHTGPELGLDQSSPVIDRVAMLLTMLERQVVGRVTMPVGTSILCVAQKAIGS